MVTCSLVPKLEAALNVHEITVIRTWSLITVNCFVACIMRDFDNVQFPMAKIHVYYFHNFSNIHLAPFFLYALTLPNINRFSKLFHCQNRRKICNNTVVKDPTTPQVCRYTTL